MATFFEKRVLTREEARSKEAMLYARGFAVYRNVVGQVPGHWNSFVLRGGWRVSWDDRNKLAVGESKREAVVMIGHAVSPRLSTSRMDEIVDDLVDSTCDLEFQQKIDDLAGRFVVFRISADYVLVQSDAAGLRPVFFTEEPLSICIGSHAKLLGELTNAPIGPMGYASFFKDSGVNSFPGRNTQYNGVLRLTPNTEVEAIHRTTRRIFPVAESAHMSVGEAASRLIEYSSSVSRLIQDYPGEIIASLSAGLDSRVTLAMNRQRAKDIHFFTYDIQYLPKNAGNRYDRETAVDIASEFDLSHEVLEVSNEPVPRDVLFALDSNSKATHSRKLAYSYFQSLPIDSTHLRSHVYEITRGYYHPFNYGISEFSGRELQYIASAGKSSTDDAVSAFQRYRDETDFANLYNYDPLDIFYWEYRSAVIMAAPLLEMDMGHDNFTMINSRALLRDLLSLPIENRRRGDVYFSAIKQLWPELLEFPINGKRVS